MDNHRIDSIARTVASTASRRTVLRGATVALLAGAAATDEAFAKKKKKSRRKGNNGSCNKGEHKCKGKCISKSRCCNDNDCPEGQQCQGKRCVCTDDRKVCGAACIPAGNCCTSSDCTGANAGACVDGACVAGFQICVKPAAAQPVTTPGTATATYVTGAASPGQSGNSAEFSVGADGRDWVHLRSADFAGVTLGALETLRYTTYVPAGTHCGMAPYMALYVTSATGGIDILLFDPGVDSTPLCDAWQTWDARNGNWRSIFHSDFAPQNDPKPLNAYQTNFGTVSLRNQNPADSDCPTAFGGIRLEAGENNPADPTGGWQNFVGYIDSLEIKLAGQAAQTFEF